MPAPSAPRRRASAASAAAGSRQAEARRSPCSAAEGALSLTRSVTAATGASRVQVSSMARQRSKSGTARAIGRAGRTSRVTRRPSSRVRVMVSAAAASPSAASARTRRSREARTRKSTGSSVGELVASSWTIVRGSSVRARVARRGSSPQASRQAVSPSAPQRRSTSSGSSAEKAPAVVSPRAVSASRSSASIGSKASGTRVR